LKVLLTLNL